MTNVAGPILQAQELAGGKNVCLQRAEIKGKAQAVQYQSVPRQQNGVRSSCLAVFALYPRAHLLRFVHVSRSSSSWDGDEVPMPCQAFMEPSELTAKSLAPGSAFCTHAGKKQVPEVPGICFLST